MYKRIMSWTEGIDEDIRVKEDGYNIKANFKRVKKKKRGAKEEEC